MKQNELNELAAEMFDPDLPGVFDAYFGNSKATGKLAKQYVETDRIVGVRSTFLCPASQVESVKEGDAIEINNSTFTVEAIETEGVALVRFILGRY